MRDPTDLLPRHRTRLGSLLRLPLRMIPSGAMLRILAGPTRGMWWIAGSGPHSNWLGVNEINKRRRLVDLVSPGDVVYDIGANVGSYTLLAAKLVGDSGQVIAIEPLPANLAFLRRHVEINALSNVRIFPFALVDRIGEIRFQGTPDRVTSHIFADGNLVVQGTTVDSLVEDHGAPPPRFLKIDVEGAEAAVLRGGARTLASSRPTIFLATHGATAREDSFRLLEAEGYELEPIEGLEEEFIATAIARG